ncbi:hypothetical protein CDL12_19392 [Handroanthus impetiginosus]|uniref:Uncharacterized protein n=1 Tax=Handroanthus impetiginosus TaxID=429701 RepID=A0A2G9GRV7_9LAMI|nr:hypothetical protein CDL12_19392 [Handroanthus impetiginosus]
MLVNLKILSDANHGSIMANPHAQRNGIKEKRPYTRLTERCRLPQQRWREALIQWNRVGVST